MFSLIGAPPLLWRRWTRRDCAPVARVEAAPRSMLWTTRSAAVAGEFLATASAIILASVDALNAGDRSHRPHAGTRQAVALKVLSALEEGAPGARGGI